MSHARYGAYKDSGVEWLGEVPVHWAVGKLKDIVFYQEGPGIMADDFQEEGVPLIRISGMKGATVSLDGCNFLDPIKVARKWPHFKLKLGELLVSASATTGIAAKVNESVVGAIPYTGLIRFKPRSKLCLDYLQYFLTANIFTYQIDLQKSGTTIQHYGPTHLGRILSVLPTLHEQTTIAAYLDSKTAQLDRKIELLGQKAAQYGKLKQSLINETVTRGLDKSVAMKDSGVEWIGKVPAHWEVQRIGTAFEERSEKVNDTDYPPLSVSMGGIVPQMESVAKTDNNENRKRVAVGDYVINSRSDRRGASGISIYDGSVSVISIVLAPRRSFFGKYLHHLFRSYSFIEEFYRVGRGIVDDLWTTRYSVMKGIEFAYPSYEEQKAIADYLDSKTAHIDRIVATLNTQIDKLKELRKALINDIVTGKICIVEQSGAGALARPAAERG